MIGRGPGASAEALLEAEDSRRRERWLRACENVSIGLFVICILFVFDFADLLISNAEDDPSSGSIANRVFWLTVLAVSGWILLLKLPLAIGVLVNAWPSILMLCWFAMTTFWADYPGLAQRRVLALAIVYFGALGLAVGFRSPRALQIGLLGAFGILLSADLLTLAVPSYSQTPIGMKGIHLHKNSAGLVAVLAFVAIVFALPRQRSALLKIATLILALWSLVFLYLTHSKTNVGIMVVVIVVAPLYYIWLRSGRIRLAFLNIAIGIGCCIVFAAATAGITIAAADLSATSRRAGR